MFQDNKNREWFFLWVFFSNKWTKIIIYFETLKMKAAMRGEKRWVWVSSSKKKIDFSSRKNLKNLKIFWPLLCKGFLCCKLKDKYFFEKNNKTRWKNKYLYKKFEAKEDGFFSIVITHLKILKIREILNDSKN